VVDVTSTELCIYVHMMCIIFCAYDMCTLIIISLTLISIPLLSYFTYIDS